jgi:hypothetical protein
VFASEYDRRGSGEVTGDELFDFIGWKPALDMVRNRWANATASLAGPACYTVVGPTEDSVIELGDDSLNPEIDQISPWDTVPDSDFPRRRGV